MKTTGKRVVFFLLCVFISMNTNVGECKTTENASLHTILTTVESALQSNDANVDLEEILTPWKNTTNNAKLELYLGLCYLDEECFGYDEEKAMTLLHKSAAKNTLLAQNWLAKLYWSKKLFTNALYWKEQAARQGDVAAIVEAVRMLRRNPGGWDNAEGKSIFWLKKLIRSHGDLQAAKELADVLAAQGKTKAARRYYTMVANAQTRMAGTASARLAELSINLRPQLYWLDRACRLGNETICRTLAKTFSVGRRVKKDTFRSAVYEGYARRIHQGDVPTPASFAKYARTVLYEFGKPMHTFSRQDAREKWRNPDTVAVTKGLQGRKPYMVECDVYKGIKGLYNELRLCYREDTLEQYLITSHLSKRDIARAEKKLIQQFGASSGATGDWKIKDSVYQTWLLPDNVVVLLHRKHHQLVTSYYHLPVVVRKNKKIVVPKPAPRDAGEPVVTVYE